jgi:hypothetical protein
MHKHSMEQLHNFFKTGLMIWGLPSLASLALGPSGLWSRPWAMNTCCSSSLAPSFPPSGTSVYLPSESSTRRCKCKIYMKIFNLINCSQQTTTMGCMDDQIHLDKNTFSILFQKGTICSSLLIILFDSDCVHKYVCNLIYLHKQQWVDH